MQNLWRFISYIHWRIQTPAYWNHLLPSNIYKLSMQSDWVAEEWMGKLRIKTGECIYKETNRILKEQFINGLNDNSMTREIIKELTPLSGMSSATGNQILAWAKRVKAQRQYRIWFYQHKQQLYKSSEPNTNACHTSKAKIICSNNISKVVWKMHDAHIEHT